MFGLGFGEVLVILVIALLVFGPDKLPEVARTLGKSMAELRRAMDDIRHEMQAPRLDLDTPAVKPAPPPNPLEGTCEDRPPHPAASKPAAIEESAPPADSAVAANATVKEEAAKS